MNACKTTLDALLKKVGTVETVQKKTMSASELRYFAEFIEPFKKEIFSRRYLFSEEKEEDMDLVLEETVLNSASACKEKDDKKIFVSAYYCKKGLVFEIKDQGPGFDYKAQLAKLKNTPLPSREFLLGRATGQGGTGLRSLKVLTDGFQYADAGRTVYFAFNLEKLKKK